MAAQGASAAQSRLLRCEDCGRPVRETEHGRTAYHVDYYSLYTGEVEEQSLASEDGERRMTFQRLLSAVEIVTCADCYRDPAVQRRREERYRPETAAAEEGEGARE
jgi:hypothetical protein